jgi:hypothetical protein
LPPFREVNRYVGNPAPMPGVFPDYLAPAILEMTLMRWGMPPPPRTVGPPVTKHPDLQLQQELGRHRYRS